MWVAGSRQQPAVDIDWRKGEPNDAKRQPARESQSEDFAIVYKPKDSDVSYADVRSGLGFPVCQLNGKFGGFLGNNNVRT